MMNFELKNNRVVEYLLMLVVFTFVLFVFGCFIGALLVAWLIIGRGYLIRNGVKEGRNSPLIYW